MKILLTDEERRAIWKRLFKGDLGANEVSKLIAKAQLKKVMHAGYVSSSGEFILPREITKEIMQALLKEVD